MNSVQFADRIGEDVLLLIPRVDPVKYQRVKLVGVESGGGLWIESQEVMNAFLQKIGVQVAPKTLVFFLPYHEIAFGLSSVAEPALNEKAFGV